MIIRRTLSVRKDLLEGQPPEELELELRNEIAERVAKRIEELNHRIWFDFLYGASKREPRGLVWDGGMIEWEAGPGTGAVAEGRRRDMSENRSKTPFTRGATRLCSLFFSIIVMLLIGAVIFLVGESSGWDVVGLLAALFIFCGGLYLSMNFYEVNADPPEGF